jgi:hypothetical protein
VSPDGPASAPRAGAAAAAPLAGTAICMILSLHLRGYPSKVKHYMQHIEHSLSAVPRYGRYTTRGTHSGGLHS